MAGLVGGLGVGAAADGDRVQHRAQARPGFGDLRQLAGRRARRARADAIGRHHVVRPGRQPRAVDAVAGRHMGRAAAILAGDKHGRVRPLTVKALDLRPGQTVDRQADRARVRGAVLQIGHRRLRELEVLARLRLVAAAEHFVLHGLAAADCEEIGKRDKRRLQGRRRLRESGEGERGAAARLARNGVDADPGRILQLDILLRPGGNRRRADVFERQRRAAPGRIGLIEQRSDGSPTKGDLDALGAFPGLGQRRRQNEFGMGDRQRIGGCHRRRVGLRVRRRDGGALKWRSSPRRFRVGVPDHVVGGGDLDEFRRRRVVAGRGEQHPIARLDLPLQARQMDDVVVERRGEEAPQRGRLARQFQARLGRGEVIVRRAGKTDGQLCLLADAGGRGPDAGGNHIGQPRPGRTVATPQLQPGAGIDRLHRALQQQGRAVRAQQIFPGRKLARQVRICRKARFRFEVDLIGRVSRPNPILDDDIGLEFGGGALRDDIALEIGGEALGGFGQREFAKIVERGPDRRRNRD